MKNLLSFLTTKKRRSIRGFVLPLTLVVCAIILAISTGISIILIKELYFSKLSRQSQVAYYAADNGLMCALMIDDHYIDPNTGIGIFEYDGLLDPQKSAQSVLNNINSERAARGYSTLSLNDIKCATSDIFNTAVSGYKVENSGTIIKGEPVITTTFSMTMDLGDGTYRCAKVSVSKTSTYRQIISRGFATCANTGIFPVERAIINTTEKQ